MKFCGGQHHFVGTCRFHLATLLNSGYVVSTVGEYFSPDGVQKTLGLGDDSFYETMVFHAENTPNDHPCGVDPDVWRGEQHTERYATPAEANAGHARLCLEWSGGESND